MDVKIIAVKNHGNAKEEYVLLEVTADCDIGHYQIGDSTYTSNGSVSNKLRHTYWFPDKPVKKGDLVCLRTSSGANETKTGSDGKQIHWFYWGLAVAVWNNDGDCAVLQHVPHWQFFKARG